MKIHLPSLNRILRDDETVKWTHLVTDERIEKDIRKSKRWSVYIILALVGIVGWFDYKSLNIAFLSELGSPSSYLRFIAVTLITAGAGWVIWKCISSYNRPNPDHIIRFFVITDQRLISTDTKGRIIQEMRADEIDFIIDKGEEKSEIHVARIEDDECTNSFYFHLFDDHKPIEALIEELRLKAKA